MNELNTHGSSSSERVHLTYVSRKGGTILLHGGHQYIAKRKHNSGLIIWECINRKKNKCRGVIKIKDTNIIEERPHLCQPDFARNFREEKVQQCKDELVSSEFPPVPKTYNAMVSQFKDSGMNLIQEIPSFGSMKSSLYRHRNKIAGVEKITCKSVEEFQVPEEYKDFLLADYLYNGNRIIVFSIQEARKIMCEIHDYLCDGTFKSCTEPFNQLYSIHGDYRSIENNTNIMPLIYAYMTRRDVESYETLFALIKSQIPGWEPKKFSIDFEKATLRAIKSTFPSAKLKGCHTHFRKAIWNKGRDLKLTTSADIYKIREVALTTVLPLLPETKIITGWVYITRRDTEDPDVLKFRKYIKDQWLKDDFIQVWCVFGERHRTTNAVEGWHHKLNSAMGKKNPNIMHALSVLREDAYFFIVRKMQITQNKEKAKKRKNKYIWSDRFIQETQMELVNGEISVGQFLEIMRH